MSYIVEPGLYAVGHPDSTSPVFVSANYKLSFDRLRSSLDGRNGWIVVLDTKGVNVWCAAGKGTFGTWELIGRIGLVSLEQVVTHRTLILPQLGAPGIKSHIVRQFSGFNIVWGPVRAEDLPAFLDNGSTATPAIRRVTFPLRERVVLIPVELVSAVKYALIAGVVLMILSAFGPDGFSVARLAGDGVRNALLALAAAILGSAVTPVLLPWLPGRAFSLKGMFAGILLSVTLAGIVFLLPGFFRNNLQYAAWLIGIPALTSFLGMNFTGASTYTSLSGVKKEMKIAIPFQIAGALVSAVLWIAGLFR
jgi:hypothetical protein